MTTLASLGRPLNVLLVEDNADDVELTRLAVARATSPVSLHVVGDAESCLAFLRRAADAASAPPTDLVLLDLNLPGHGGLHILRAITSDPALCHLPVVTLTTSSAAHEILAAYRLRCSSYVTKPFEFERFVAVIDRVLDYWTTVAALPLVPTSLPTAPRGEAR